MLVVAMAFSVAACAGKGKSSATDVEAQAFEDLRSEIREVIDDPARAAEAIALVNALPDELSALRRDVADRKRRARQLNADYDASRADFEALAEQFNRERRAGRQRVLDEHREFLALVTPEEWAEISKAHTKAMKATIKSMQAI
jgi:capsule polysaccharide export protein KpsE/RkpR